MDSRFRAAAEMCVGTRLGGAKDRGCMPKKSVTLSNGKSWQSRGDTLEYFRALRDRQKLDTPISDPGDHDDLLALLERYDLAIVDGPTKIGAGVDHFETRVNVTNGGRNVGFWVIRSDGSETDFSFIRAVNAAPKRAVEQLTDACRRAVYAELQTAKIRHFAMYGDDNGRIRCALSGDPIDERDTALEYIEAGFAELVRSFARTQGWEELIPAGVISDPADAQTTTAFISADHAEAFRDFHRASAKIRLVKKSARTHRTRESSAANSIRLLEL